MVADSAPTRENRPFTCGFSHYRSVLSMPDATPELSGWHR